MIQFHIFPIDFFQVTVVFWANHSFNCQQDASCQTIMKSLKSPLTWKEYRQEWKTTSTSAWTCCKLILISWPVIPRSTMWRARSFLTTPSHWLTYSKALAAAWSQSRLRRAVIRTTSHKSRRTSRTSQWLNLTKVWRIDSSVKFLFL